MIAVLFGLLTAASWAVGSVMIRDLALKLDPFTLNAPRSTVGALALVALALATGHAGDVALVTPVKAAFLIGSLLLGAVLGDSAYVLSMQRIGVSRAFPISSVYPVLTLGLGLLFLREHITIWTVGGLVLALAGVLLIGRPAAGERQDRIQVAVDRAGVGYALVAAVFWAVSTVLVAPGIKGLDPIMAAALRMPVLAATFWIIVAVRRTGASLRTLTRREWVLVVVGGLIGWGLGSVFFVRAVELLGPTRAAIITSTSPLFALPLSVAFLRERVHGGVLVGTLMTVVGVALVS